MRLLLFSAVVIGLAACTSLKPIEFQGDGGTFRFYNRDYWGKGFRDFNSIQEAVDYCKDRGFDRYVVTDSTTDGKIIYHHFKCVH